jgi:hypothetical protein
MMRFIPPRLRTPARFAAIGTVVAVVGAAADSERHSRLLAIIGMG